VFQGQWQRVGMVRVSGEFPKGPVEFLRSFGDYISNDHAVDHFFRDISLRGCKLGVFTSSLR